MTASERPGLAGCRCQEAEGGTDNKSDGDGGYHRGAGVAVSCAVEYLDEVVVGGAGPVGWEIAEAEAEGNGNGETKGAVAEDRADYAPGDNGRCILDFFCHMDGTIVS